VAKRVAVYVKPFLRCGERLRSTSQLSWFSKKKEVLEQHGTVQDKKKPSGQGRLYTVLIFFI